MCGIAGVFAPGTNVVPKLLTILEKEWNRGHTSYGAEAYDLDGVLHVRKGARFPDEKSTRGLSGELAIAHLRYSTRGSNEPDFLKRNAQPLALGFAPYNGKGRKPQRLDYAPVENIKIKDFMVIAHNGDIFDNGVESDYLYQCDIKYLAWPLARQLAKMPVGEFAKKDVAVAARKVVPELRGSFTYVGYVVDGNGMGTMFAGKDPWGIKPGYIGRVRKGWAVASEDAALLSIGCDYDDIMEMEDGHLYVMDAEEDMVKEKIKVCSHAECAFEHVYFSDIGTTIKGKNVGLVRRKIGMALGREQPAADADMVIPVPDSGRSIASGFADATRLPYFEGFSKNRKRDVRTFILQEMEDREAEILRKLIAIRAVLRGKKVAVVDDSLVRGNTMRKIVDIIRRQGMAEEVHVRIGSPPLFYPCYLGIDMKTRGEFSAARAAHKLGYDIYKGFENIDNAYPNEEQMDEIVETVRKEIGADSLGYLSLESMMNILGNECCFGCWNAALNPLDLRDEIFRNIKEHPDGLREEATSGV